MSVSLYALIGWRRERGTGTEAAIKYLILAGASSAFLLFGMALIYADTGTMDLAQLAAAGAGQGPLAPVGLAMMLVGIGFKLAVVPFHLWTPDVYDGAPAPVTGFIATVSKGAMVVVLARAFAPALVGAGGGQRPRGDSPGAVSAAFPLGLCADRRPVHVRGEHPRPAGKQREADPRLLLHRPPRLHPRGVPRRREPRRCAPSPSTSWPTSPRPSGAFAVDQRAFDPERDADSLEDYRGLAARRPWLAAALTAMLLSLAGLPLTAGFVGKFIILRAGAGAELWVLAVILAVNGTISIFYYLKIVSAMFRGLADARSGAAEHGGQPRQGMPPGVAAEREGAAGGMPPSAAVMARAPFLAALALAALTLGVVALGVYPSPVLSFIGSFTVGGL